MLDRKTIFEIHRLKNEGYSGREIAIELGIGRNTVKRYLEEPEKAVSKRRPRASKLDPYKELIDQFLKKRPQVKAPVVFQRIKEKGYDGKLTILRDYLKEKRGTIKSRQAFIRFESDPGQQLQIDWGHFGSLAYGDTKRKIYALLMTESYSRMLHVEFTHSQKQEALHQALLNGFIFFGGTPKEIVVDNMLTAVIERQGKLIRFNDAFLDFLRVLKIVPIACNVKAPYEKGKIERSIGYVRQNFWPLRTFTDLYDVQTQVDKWRDNVANVRIHRTTGDAPIARFANVKLRPLPDLLPDCRETCQLNVHKDFAVRFDSNYYTTPPWAIGKKVTLKADQNTVTIYYLHKKITVHTRSWERNKRIENEKHKEKVKKVQKKLFQDRQIVIFTSLGPEAYDYLEELVKASQPIKKNVSKLLQLKDEYGSESIIYAIKKAMQYKAYGADYIENILYQEMTPQNTHQPVKLKNDVLNRISLTEPSLADYDTYVIKNKRKNND